MKLTLKLVAKSPPFKRSGTEPAYFPDRRRFCQGQKVLLSLTHLGAGEYLLRSRFYRCFGACDFWGFFIFL